VGLVGSIAISYITSNLKLSELAFMNLNLLPPVIVLEKGLPHSPVRVFGNDEFLALSSEIPIPTNSLQSVMTTILDWIKQKRTKEAIILGGIPVPNRQELQEPRIFGCASDEASIKTLSEYDVELMEQGFLVGPQALILNFCAQNKIPAIGLLAEAFYNYPDPEAAAVVIKKINQIIRTQIDVTQLLKQGEEVRLSMRDMMKRTQTELTNMNKSQEFDTPRPYIA